ncbi:MAG: hypothetical protein HYV97_15220 [Bdellovibrio sp.]|nr:hypothetical protein [Bdellovibrio sp.]
MHFLFFIIFLSACSGVKAYAIEKTKIFHCDSFSESIFEFVKKNDTISQLEFGEEHFSLETKRKIRTIRVMETTGSDRATINYFEPGFDSVAKADKTNALFGISKKSNGDYILDDSNCTSRFSMRQVQDARKILGITKQTESLITDLLKSNKKKDVIYWIKEKKYFLKENEIDKKVILQLIQTRDKDIIKAFTESIFADNSKSHLFFEIFYTLARTGDLETAKLYHSFEIKIQARGMEYHYYTRVLKYAIVFRHLDFVKYIINHIKTNLRLEYEEALRNPNLNYGLFTNAHELFISSNDSNADYGQDSYISIFKEVLSAYPNAFKQKNLILNMLKSIISARTINVELFQFLLSLDDHESSNIVDDIVTSKQANTYLSLPVFSPKIADFIFHKYLSKILPETHRLISSYSSNNNTKVDDSNLNKALVNSIFWGQTNTSLKIMEKISDVNFCETVSSSDYPKFSPVEAAILTADVTLLNELIKKGVKYEFTCLTYPVLLLDNLKSCELEIHQKILDFKFIQNNRSLHLKVLTEALESTSTTIGRENCYKSIDALLAKTEAQMNIDNFMHVLRYANIDLLNLILKHNNDNKLISLGTYASIMQKVEDLDFDTFGLFHNQKNEAVNTYIKIMNVLKKYEKLSDPTDYTINQGAKKVIVKIGLSYPVCGAIDTIKTYSSAEEKESNGTILLCLHIEAGLDWSNLNSYKILEFKNKMIHLELLTKNNEHSADSFQIDNKDIWIKEDDFGVPYWLSEANTRIAVPHSRPSEFILQRNLLQITGDDSICNLESENIKLMIAKKRFNLDSGSNIFFIIPPDFKLEKAYLESNFQLDYKRSCGT